MKIALLITGLGMGGAERQVIDLADRFAALDHEVMIIYLTGEAAILPANSSIRVTGMGMTKTPWSFFNHLPSNPFSNTIFQARCTS